MKLTNRDRRVMVRVEGAGPVWVDDDPQKIAEAEQRLREKVAVRNAARVEYLLGGGNSEAD